MNFGILGFINKIILNEAEFIFLQGLTQIYPELSCRDLFCSLQVQNKALLVCPILPYFTRTETEYGVNGGSTVKVCIETGVGRIAIPTYLHELGSLSQIEFFSLLLDFGGYTVCSAFQSCLICGGGSTGLVVFKS